jgi:ribosomal protein S18 acetylase RimI-like enzyme
MCGRAFRDTPHVAHFFPNEERRAVDVAAMFAMRIRYGLLYGEIRTTSPALEGIAVWIPSERATMTMWQQIRAGGMRLYRSVGADAVARMTHVAEHNDRLRTQHVQGKDWYLSILAVDPDHQGRGHATRLLGSMLDRPDRESLACYVETTEQELIAFYQHFGFDPGGASTVPGTDLTVWPLVRPSRAQRQAR